MPEPSDNNIPVTPEEGDDNGNLNNENNEINEPRYFDKEDGGIYPPDHEPDDDQRN